MPYVDFPEGTKGQKERKRFWLSPDGCKLISGWRRNGVTIQKVATENIGISTQAFRKWCEESEELRAAINAGKEAADYAVEDALYRRAVGYDYWEEQWDLVEGDVIMTKKFKKHLPPDPKSIMNYLYNRRPEVWRSVQEPLEATQYADTIKNILVAMREVAQGGGSKRISPDPIEVEYIDDSDEVK